MRRIIPRIAFAYLFIFICAIILAHGPGAWAQEWSQPVRISGPGGGSWPQLLAVGHSLYVVYQNEIDHDRDFIYFMASLDAGYTWSFPTMLSDSAYHATNPNIMEFRGRLIAMWDNWHQTMRRNVRYRASSDQGYTWSVPFDVLSPDLEFCVWASYSSADSIVNVMAWERPVTDSILLYSITSTDFGQSWMFPVRIYRAWAALGVGDQVSFASQVHHVWAGGLWDRVDNLLNYLRSTDYGQTWADIVPLNLEEDWEQYPAIAVNQNGEIGVAWIENRDVFLRQSRDAGLTWDSIKQVTYSHNATDNCDIALEGNSIFLAWHDRGRNDFGNSAIIFNKSLDGGQTWDEEYWIDRDTSFSWHPSLAASKGMIYIVWMDSRANPDTNIARGLYFSRWPDWPDAIGDDGADALPRKITLSAYPNPFNSSVIISYRGASVLSIAIYDIEGRLVRNLRTDPDDGDIMWDAMDEKGRGLSSGVYFARAVGKDDLHSAYLKLIYIK